MHPKRERPQKRKNRFVGSIVELYDRALPKSRVDGELIYLNDCDNLYPNRVELVQRNSPTAFCASEKLKSFIIGKGFADPVSAAQITNRRTKERANGCLRKLATSLKTHRGAFIHLNYDVEGEVNYLDVLDYKKCRIGKEDCYGYSGLVYFRDWREDRFGVFPGWKKYKDKGGRWFYPYNPNLDVINDQRQKDAPGVEGLKKYRGQVFFLNLDDCECVYPYAWLQPAYNDADSEFRISLYRNKNLRSGFLNKTMIIPNGLSDEDKKEFQQDVKGWLGAENSDSVFVISPEAPVEDVDNIIKTIELKGTYDSKRFDLDERNIRNNIRKTYLGIPNLLIEPQDSFFSASGEAIRAAVDYYNEETADLRLLISKTMEMFYPDEDWRIEPLGQQEVVATA